MSDLTPRQIATLPTSFLQNRLRVLQHNTFTRAGTQALLISAELDRRNK